jgi:hypothetical protein
MRKILLMAKRDYVEASAQAFILGLIVAPLLFGGGFLGIAIPQKQPDLSDKRIASSTTPAPPLHASSAVREKRKDLYAKARQQIAPRYVL